MDTPLDDRDLYLSGEDEDTYKQERESERIDEYFAPSEGYVY
jgi:hypothetical protein